MVNGGYAIADLSFITSEQWFSIEDGTELSIPIERARQILNVFKTNKILFYAMINDITGDGIKYDIIKNASYFKDASVETVNFTISIGAGDIALVTTITSDGATIVKDVGE